MWTRKLQRPAPGVLTRLLATGWLSAALLLAPAAASAVGEVEPNDSAGQAQDLTSGTPLSLATASGGIAVEGSVMPDNVDYYAVDLLVGEQLTAAVTDAAAGEFHDGSLAVFDPNGNLVASDDDSGPGFHPQLIVPVTASGSWTVAVTGFGDVNFTGLFHQESFDYRLVVAVEADPPLASEVDSSPPPGLNDDLASADPMAEDADVATVSGFSDNQIRNRPFVPDDLDFFSVEVSAGQLVTATVVDPDSGADADAVVELYDENGVLVASNDDGGPRLLPHVQAEAASSGSYSVAVRGFDYFYTFLAVPGPPLPEPDFGYQLVVSKGAGATVLMCDVDGDAQVDQRDINLIFAARGEPALGPDDPMDVDGDGTITVLDGRACVLECTFANCAQTGCGLLGIEPMLLIGGALALRRHRAGKRARTDHNLNADPRRNDHE